MNIDVLFLDYVKPKLLISWKGKIQFYLESLYILNNLVSPFLLYFWLYKYNLNTHFWQRDILHA